MYTYSFCGKPIYVHFILHLYNVVTAVRVVKLLECYMLLHHLTILTVLTI